jgi:hypothetical protein
MVAELNNGFHATLPSDVLSVTEGPRLPARPAPVPPATAPDVLVDYEIVPSGRVYEHILNGVPTGGPKYAGIFVNFQVQLRIPNDVAPLDLHIRVEPPPQFRVASSSADADVYTVMLQRAIGELSTRVREVFFKKNPGAGDDKGGR